MPKVLITGAGGFVGHHFLEHILVHTDWQITCTDSFRHKGKTNRIMEVLGAYDQRQLKGHGFPGAKLSLGRVKTFTHDLTAPFSRQSVHQLEGTDYIVAFASDSHVDRSITDPVPFIKNNIDVATNTLELARELKPQAVVLISTDEVYGPVEPTDLEGHPEWDTILPSNPYSASKAAQEAIAISYWRTYGVPLILVNCMNMIGERQDVEKFVPLVLSKILRDEVVTIHGTADHIGTRHYLHARNLADGILFLLNNQRPAVFRAHLREAYKRTQDILHFVAERPDRYNIACPDRIDNLTMAHMIADFAGKQLRYELQDFHSTRPGHDPHYGLSARKMANLGWTPPLSLETTLKKTVEWTMAHPSWLLSDLCTITITGQSAFTKPGT